MSSHMIRGRQLSRDTEHRKAMRRNLVQSLFEHGKVRTTMPKAQEVRAMAELFPIDQIFDNAAYPSCDQSDAGGCSAETSGLRSDGEHSASTASAR